MKYRYLIHEIPEGTVTETTREALVALHGVLFVAVLIASGSISMGLTVYEYKLA